MKWFDELLEARSAAPDDAYGILVPMKNIDRILTIVDYFSDHCGICVAVPELGHRKDCPYSDEWEARYAE